MPTPTSPGSIPAEKAAPYATPFIAFPASFLVVLLVAARYPRRIVEPSALALETFDISPVVGSIV